MKITKLEIEHFGKLNNFILEPKEGSNFIYGRNEDGKSTVMAFIRMMFYGNVGSSREIKANARKKYRPWNGAPMGGSIEFCFRNVNYRLQKHFGQTAGRDEVSLFNLDTGETVALRADEEVGTHFFGMTLEGFERSMFIGGTGGFENRENKSDGITERLINLTTSNDENVSLKDTVANVEKAMEKLISKRGNAGYLVEARNETAALELELKEAKAADSAKRSTRDELEALFAIQGTEKERLKKVQEQRRLLSAMSDEIDEKQESLQTLERRAELFRVEMQKRKEDAEAAVRSAEEQVNHAKEAADSGNPVNLIPLFGVLSVLILIAAVVLAILIRPLFALIALVIPPLVMGMLSANSRKRRTEAYRKAALTRSVQLEEKLEDLLEETGKREAEDEKALGRIEAEANDSAVALKRLRARTRELSKQLEAEDGLEDRIIDREQKIAEIRGSLADGSKPASLIIDELETARKKRDDLEKKYAALSLAKTALEQAGEELRMNFGPRLNTRTADIFGGLTGGKYSGVNVSKTFGIRVLEDGDVYYREGGYLSNGTIDQVYFALRLAIAEIMTEAEGEMLTLLLDDIFEQYDDGRAASGLRFLDEYARKRNGQVIFFSCHGRVLDMAREVAENAAFFSLQK